jgi:Zn-dependent protease with chaperone function
MKLFGASLITLSLMLSFVFFIVILALLFTNSINIGLAIGLTIIINVIMWLIGPAITDWINRYFYKVDFLTPQAATAQYPHLAELISTVANDHKFPFPKIGIIADNNPTAFTYGSARYNARLIITNGIFKYLNEDEQKAVVAHELGHIVNRDFIVMMVASTLVQILYELYAVLIRMRGRNNPLPLVGLVSYVLYVIASYLLLFLSRTRETLADAFSAQVTEPEDLSNALIKIAYGIVSEADDGSTKRLLSSTRHMGLIDVKSSKMAGSYTYIANNQQAVVADAMVFDAYNPWAKWLELNSTHPLTGRRVRNLSQLPSKSGRSFSYDVDGAAERMRLDKNRLWSNFLRDVAVILLPFVAFGGLLLLSRNIFLAILGFGLGFLFKALYRFPRHGAEPSTVLDEMRNPYASPVRGKAITLEGQVVGRGVPGYIFSEDMMYQDRTGLIFLNYSSLFGIFGNLFFALKKLKNLVGQAATAEGWYFRGVASSLSLRQLRAGQTEIKSYEYIWAMVWPVLLLIVLSLIALYMVSANLLPFGN